MNAQRHRKLPINREDVLTLMEDLGIDEDVARGMIAVRLGFTDHIVVPPPDDSDRRPGEHVRMEQTAGERPRGKGTHVPTAP